MDYNEVLEKARKNIGPYCKACPVCNGRACANAMPGPGSKNPGNGAARNYDAWQRVFVNMDTICSHETPTTNPIHGKKQKTWDMESPSQSVLGVGREEYMAVQRVKDFQSFFIMLPPCGRWEWSSRPR